MARYNVAQNNMVTIKPEPWQLRTAEDAYTPYFVPADQLFRCSNPTWVLSTGFHYPSSYPPMTFEERKRAIQQDTMQLAGKKPLQLVHEHIKQQTEEDCKAANLPKSSKAVETPVDTITEEDSVEDLSFDEYPVATKKVPRTPTRVMERKTANRLPVKNDSPINKSPIKKGKNVPTASEFSKIVKHKAKPKAKPRYSASPPSVLWPSQKRRWGIAYASLSKQMEFDPKHKRAYSELGLLTKLAELMGRSSPPFSGMWYWMYRDLP